MTATETADRPRFLTTAEACKRLGIGRTKFYELRQEDGFPRPARFGYRTLRWREDEIDDWFESSRDAVSP